MPNATQQIPVSFASGLDTKTDPKQVMPGKLLELENGVFTKTGSINKRYGFEKLTTDVEADGYTISGGEGISSINDELLLFSGSNAYSYSGGSDTWIDKGSVVNVISSNETIIRNAYQQIDPDGVHNQGLRAYVWEDSRGGIRYSIVDDATGAYVIPDTQLVASGTAPKTVAFGNYFFLFWKETNNLNYKTINIRNVSTTSAVFNVSTLCAGGYDATVIGSKVFIAFDQGSVGVVTVDSLLTVSATSSYPINTDPIAVTIFEGPAEGAFIGTIEPGGDVNFGYINYLNDTLYTSGTFGTVFPFTGTPRITGIHLGGGSLAFLYDQPQTDASNCAVLKGLTQVDGYSSQSVFLRGVGLASKAFTYNDISYINLVHDSSLQATYFTATFDGKIVSKTSPNQAGGLRTAPTLPEVSFTDDGVAHWTNQIKGRLVSNDTVLYSLLGLNATLIDFASPNRRLTAKLGNNLLLSGGILQTYDGNSFVESGFHLYPEDGYASFSATAGHLTSGSSYQYVFTYEWTDNLGQLYRSATSIPLTYLPLVNNKSVDLRIPTLRLTSKSNVTIEVYRTEGNGSIFYKLTSPVSPTYNDPTVDTITYHDGAADSSILANGFLYTTGGELDNMSPPSCAIISNFKNRIALAGLDTKNTIWYSKITPPGESVAFSDSLTITVDSKGGDITALATMDDKLIIFKKAAIYYVSGDGPNNAGEQNDFTEPQLVTTDVGCDNPKSIINTSAGLMFQSTKGIYLLSRGMEAGYIGSSVEAFNSEGVTSAVLVPNTNQVRFTTSSRVLVYDYLYGQWSTFTRIPAVDADIWGDLYVYVKSNGNVYVETPGEFLDDNQYIKLRLVTGWFSFAGLQNFQRVRKVILLGEYKGPHDLILQSAYDMNDVYLHSQTINTSSIIDTDDFGTGDPYGSDSVYGGPLTPYQFDYHFTRQQCTSVKLSIEDSQSSNFNEGLSLSGITFEVGVKRGGNKLPANRSVAG